MLKRLRAASNAFGVMLFVLLFLVFVVQVTARFAFNQPLAWTDELAVILYLWAILWGAALVCEDRENVAFDLLYQKASPALQRAMAIAGCALIGGLCAWAPARLNRLHRLHATRAHTGVEPAFQLGFCPVRAAADRPDPALRLAHLPTVWS